MGGKLWSALEVNGVMGTKVTDRLLLDSLDDTLREVLSEQFRIAFYNYLETGFSLPRTLIPDRLGDFQSVLSKALGPTGSAILEKAVAKRLYLKLGLRFAEKPSYTLLQYIREAEITLQNR